MACLGEEWVWIRVWSGPGWDEGDEGVEVGLGWDEGSCPAWAGMRNVEAGLGRGEGGSERIREDPRGSERLGEGRVELRLS